MSFCRQPVPIPDETRDLAERVCVGPTAWYLSLSRELRRIYSALGIERLYPDAGQWGVHPFRAFAFLMLQILEGLSDRDAAGQVPINIGWKYVLALPLDHPVGMPQYCALKGTGCSRRKSLQSSTSSLKY